MAVRNAPVLREEIAVLLAKDAIEPVPPAEMRLYCPYFIVPKKGGGLRPILDLRVLNRALHKLPFKILTHRRMIKCIQTQNWFAAIDLKDAYFHVSILPRQRPRLLWHINCLELWAVHLALRQFRPLLLGKHVLVCTDNTAAVSYINRLGGIRSHRMSQLARHLLLWSHTQFKSLRAVHIPAQLNRAADALSRQLTFPGE